MLFRRRPRASAARIADDLFRALEHVDALVGEELAARSANGNDAAHEAPAQAESRVRASRTGSGHAQNR